MRSAHNLGQENVLFLVLCVCVRVFFLFCFLVEKVKRGMIFKSRDLYYP